MGWCLSLCQALLIQSYGLGPGLGIFHHFLFYERERERERKKDKVRLLFFTSFHFSIIYLSVVGERGSPVQLVRSGPVRFSLPKLIMVRPTLCRVAVQ